MEHEQQAQSLATGSRQLEPKLTGSGAALFGAALCSAALCSAALCGQTRSVIVAGAHRIGADR
jgi:Mn2+/Fe2+ NRAMP family transporter